MKTIPFTRLRIALCLVLVVVGPAAWHGFSYFRNKPRTNIDQQTTNLYLSGEYSEAIDLIQRQLDRGERAPALRQKLAECLIAQGAYDKAIDILIEVFRERGPNCSVLEKDPAFAKLRGSARWSELTAACSESMSNFCRKKGSNRRLYELCHEDQADRESTLSVVLTIPPPVVDDSTALRDRRRREQVAEILRANQARTDDDWYWAALIHQHGEKPEDFLKAHEFIKKAIAVNPDMLRFGPLFACTWDRYLLSIGKPQIYGTQYKIINGKEFFQPIDRGAVTDEERARLWVPIPPGEGDPNTLTEIAR